jgi:hypothetical protein
MHTSHHRAVRPGMSLPYQTTVAANGCNHLDNVSGYNAFMAGRIMWKEHT